MAETIDITPSWVSVIKMYQMVIDSNTSNILDSVKKLQQEDLGFDPLVAIADYYDEIVGSAEAINKTMNEFSSEMNRIAKVVDEMNHEKEPNFEEMSVEERMEVAKQGRPQDLDILVHDPHEDVRWEVAINGRPQDLDILVNDENYDVREAVARHGRPQDLDVLVNDKNKWVRQSVAEQERPQDLDILVNDKDFEVRMRVAERGRPQDLDILVHDESSTVRYPVAEAGRPEDLDILVKDEDSWVRETAQRMLIKQQSEPSLDSEAKDMSAAKDAQDVPAAGHDKDKGVI